MINVKLSKRLKAIADLVDKDSKIIDVGCDHALLDIYLLKNKNDLFNKNIQNIIDKNNNILKMLPKRMFIKKIKIKYNNIKLKKEMKQ